MEVFLLFGSNQGDRLANLQYASRQVNERIGQLVLKSSVYSTSAWGNTQQADFLNQVQKVLTTYTPQEILSTIQSIEKGMGRQRTRKWGARIIDIDILYFDDSVVSSPNLTIPHPQIAFRRFTLAPLVEIAPLLVHPVLRKTQAQLLEECADQLAVTKIDEDSV